MVASCDPVVGLSARGAEDMLLASGADREKVSN